MKHHQISAACVVALLSGVTCAQVIVPPSADPGALQQQRLDEAQRRQDQERLERKPVDEPVTQEAPKSAAAPSANAVKFNVREIRFEPTSEVFTAEELKALAKDVEGKEASFADLQRLAERINEAYREKGVVTSRAVIRPQDVTSGVITLQLVEGKLGAISVTGNASTRESYILNRVEAEPGKLVDLPTLQASMLQFNRTNSAQLRAALKPGQTFGSTDLVLDVSEPKNSVFRAGLDNLGSEVTGRTRFGLAYANQSVLGWRDSLNLALMSASGLKSYSLDYGIPVSRSGGRLNLAYSDDATKLKFGPFAALNITGKSSATSVSLRQPMYFGERSQLDVLAGLRKRDVENKVSGVFLSSTATEDLQLGLEYQADDPSGQWLTNYTLYNGRATSADVRTRYTVGRGALRRTQFMGNGWALRGALAMQHTSSDALPSSEQFFLGGEGSVRGYTVGAVAGDQGATLSVELQHPITGSGAGAEGQSFAANGFFFLDAGHVRLILPPDSILAKSQTLTSVGWGARMAIGAHVSGQFTLAYALKKLENEPRRYTASFQLNSQF